jgi:hypothetical protein
MKAVRPSRLFVPPLAYAGERERLAEERGELLAALKRLPPRSRLRAGLEYRLVKVTTRLIATEGAIVVPGSNRADFA